MKMQLTKKQEHGVDSFFRYARLRHECYLMKQRDPTWATKDSILYKYRFTNVFRDLDKTSAWFIKHVRGPMNEKRDENIMLATVVFRMLNRIETGEAMFCDDKLFDGHSAFDEYVRTGKPTALKTAIIKRLGKKGPYVTGGYIISSPPGYSKLDGMLRVINGFRHEYREWVGLGAGVLDTMKWDGEEGCTTLLACGPGEYTLEDTWKWIKQFTYFGPFHAYEIVTDLRHTYLLDKAPDIMTWANPGPGCRRGANRVMGLDKDTNTPREELIDIMRLLLKQSKVREQWPRDKDHPSWEMRDVEHTLCEFDKYERVRTGDGRPRGVYR